MLDAVALIAMAPVFVGLGVSHVGAALDARHPSRSPRPRVTLVAGGVAVGVLGVSHLVPQPLSAPLRMISVAAIALLGAATVLGLIAHRGRGT